MLSAYLGVNAPVSVIPLTYAALRKAETVGRPVGSVEWLVDMEARTGKQLAPGKRGRRPVSNG